MVTYTNGYVRVQHTQLKIDARLPFQFWLRETQAAIRIRRAATSEKPTDNKERFAAIWLHANDLQTPTKIAAFEERVRNLESGPDPSRIVRCAKCQRVLSDPLSKALGLGPECRKK